MSLSDHHTRDSRTGPRTHHSYAVQTQDGFDGVVRIATLLRQRAYQVKGLTAEVEDTSERTTVTCTIAVTPDEAALFERRLLRVPSVISVERH